MITSRRGPSRLFLALASGLGLIEAVLLGLLLTKAGSALMAWAPSDQALAGSPSSDMITAVGRHRKRNGVPFEVRGMNYYPKDYAWDRFWISYTAALR